MPHAALSPMKPSEKYALVTRLPFAVFLATPFATLLFYLGFGGRYAFVVFATGFLATIALSLYVGRVLACERCGKSPYVFARHKSGRTLGATPWAETTCSECGNNLSERTGLARVGGHPTRPE